MNSRLLPEELTSYLRHTFATRIWWEEGHENKKEII